MATKTERAMVKLWGTVVGTVIWENNLGHFEYDQQFLSSGIQLSPIEMPLNGRSYAFSALNTDTFKGLPGLLADSLPDKFGNQLIDQWLERQGRRVETFSPIERLCYIGERGMGGLEFTPLINPGKEQSQAIEIANLVELANQALNSKSRLNTGLAIGSEANNQQAVEQIISVGTSAGGARAKAVIAWNPQTNKVKSGQVKTTEAFSYWLLKFDGVENNRDHEALSDPKGFSIVEYAYYLMAVDAGIEMSECRLFKENGRSHFMTKRFDRLAGGEKVHMQSLCGLAHYDFNQAGAYSYEQAIGVMRDLLLPNDQLEQFFRRMVFNIVARNQDDHTKNISFLMDKRGHWRLSPGYDITHCYGEGWTKQHQMTVNGKRDHFILPDLLSVAEHADINKAKATKIVNEVIASVSRWFEFAELAGVPQDIPDNQGETSWTSAIAKTHRLKW